MALEYGFYNSVMGDRRYNSVQMSEIFEGLITDGVYPSVGDKFAVRPSEGMQVIVGTGRAWFDGTWSKNRTPYPIDIDQADPIFDRIDTICIKVDKNPSARMNSFEVLKGVVSSEPFPIAPPTDELNVFYHPIAYVTVKAHATDISTADIELLVGKSVCPFTTSILQQTDIDELFDQWTAQFIGWWDSIKEILSGDVVGNILGELMNKVDISDKATSDDVFMGTDDTKWVTPNAASYGLLRPGMVITSYTDLTDSPRFVRMNGVVYGLDPKSTFAESKYAIENKFRTSDTKIIDNVNKIHVGYACSNNGRIELYGEKIDSVNGNMAGYFGLDYYDAEAPTLIVRSGLGASRNTNVYRLCYYNGHTIYAYIPSTAATLTILVDGVVRRTIAASRIFDGKEYTVIRSYINEKTRKPYIIMAYKPTTSANGANVYSSIIVAYINYTVEELAFNSAEFSYSSIMQLEYGRTAVYGTTSNPKSMDPDPRYQHALEAYDGTAYFLILYNWFYTTTNYQIGRRLALIRISPSFTTSITYLTTASVDSDFTLPSHTGSLDLVSSNYIIYTYTTARSTTTNIITQSLNIASNSSSSYYSEYRLAISYGLSSWFQTEDTTNIYIYYFNGGKPYTVTVPKTNTFSSGSTKITSEVGVFKTATGIDIYERDIKPYLEDGDIYVSFERGPDSDIFIDDEQVVLFPIRVSSNSTTPIAMLFFAFDPSTPKFTFILRVPFTSAASELYTKLLSTNIRFIHKNEDGTYALLGATGYTDLGGTIEYIPIPEGDNNSYFVI